MRDNIKIAGVQMEPTLMANEQNLEKMLYFSRISAGAGADLIVFPECALTGYVFKSRVEAIPFMETVPGPSTEKLTDFCCETSTCIVTGLLEVDGDKCFNAAVLLGPQGLIGKYRKIHLPFLGIDRFLDRGDQPFKVFKTDIGNIGIHICYDCTFPESARTLTLMGADILVLPTNWPQGRERVTNFIIPARAYENRVYVAAIDRVGIERGVKFIGLSKIVDTMGDILGSASEDKEEIIYAEISLSAARQKRLVIKQGEFETDTIADRRPEFYGEITKEK